MGDVGWGSIAAVLLLPALAFPQDPAPIPQDPSPTPTPAPSLRLQDVFGGHAAPVPAERRSGYDPNGPVLSIPDTSAWRLPATPTPTPPPTATPALIAAEKPKLALPPNAIDPRIENATGNALAPQGEAEPVRRIAGHALLGFRTDFNMLMTEYRLYPVTAEGRDAGAPLVFLHAPRTAERLGIPEGLWRLERRLWRPEAPAAILTERWPAQRLREANQYLFDATPDSEERYLQRVRSLVTSD